MDRLYNKFAKSLYRTHQKKEPVIISIQTRQLIAADPTRPSIAQLPDPILRNILLCVKEARPEILPVIASLSSSLYEQARYVQHHEVHIDINNSKHVLDRLHLIQRLDQLVAIRVLRVDGERHPNDDDTMREILDHLASLVPAMTGLRDVHWHAHQSRPLLPTFSVKSLDLHAPIPIPSSILVALTAECRVHTSLNCHAINEAHAQTRTFLQGLEGNQNLQTLSIRVLYTEEPMGAETMRGLTKVLLSCPNLTRIPKIHVWFPQGGCYAYGPTFEEGPYTGIYFPDGEMLNPLEELGMDLYPWGREGARWHRGYRLKGLEQDYWVKNFNWSHLRRLNGYLEPELSRAFPMLTNLREIDLTYGWNYKLAREFLRAITSPLEQMILPCWESIGSRPELISQFGGTLRELKIGGGGASALMALDLAQLSKDLPHLEHLAIHIEWNREEEDWPFANLKAIAALPRLRSAELWFRLICGRPPYLTYSVAQRLLCYMNDHNGGFQRLTLHSGVPTPNRVDPFSPNVDVTPSWSMRNSVTFECEMAYDHDPYKEDGQRCKARIWCKELSVEMNAKLRQLDQKANRKQPNVKTLDPAGVLLRAALDGPLDSAEWRAWREEQLRLYGPLPGSVDEFAQEIEAYWARLNAPFSLKLLFKELCEYVREEYDGAFGKNRRKMRT
ncbi:unnamed protein product [Clonostachys byssicola]|uniref:Uncharacterized protein n=1 Tax=Clonostachys byssicola TaxID=160290 RepID=A0A9N9TX75_9HYPO|nr:unnamed protein product [Clonostachys byssicola]